MSQVSVYCYLLETFGLFPCQLMCTVTSSLLRIKLCGICAKKSLSLNFFSLFFQNYSLFYRNRSLKKKWILPYSGFSGPKSEPIKLPSPLIGILSDFSSSWKVPNVRLWLLLGHNLSTIVYNIMKSAKLSNIIYLQKCFI